jgi:membrane protein DedA with SNARE-associated domain
MPRRTFFVWNGLGGSVWALLFGLLGYFLGRNIPLLDRVTSALGLAGLLAVVAFVGGLIVLWFIRRRRNEQAARAAIAAESHPPADAAADAAADEPLD